MLVNWYPQPLVHPGHARKMAAKLAAQGHSVYFHEPFERGNAGATDNAHVAFNIALSWKWCRRGSARGLMSPTESVKFSDPLPP